MTTSPDYVPYADLTLYDKSPSDILAAGIATLQSRWPTWTPTATGIEVALLEALAVEIGETIFTVNRLPSSLVYYLMSLYGVERDPGAPPSVVVKFTAQDNVGYFVPASTEVSLALPTGEYMSFYTNADLAITAPNLTGTVTATATVHTNVANGIDAGTELAMVDSVSGIISAVTFAEVVGGDLPETEESFRQRSIQRLQRLVDTLVTPDHFIQAALENPAVVRATAIDNYDPEGEGQPGDNPGYMNVVVYGDNAALSTQQKDLLQGDLEGRAAANLIVTVTDPTVVNVDIRIEFVTKPGYSSSSVIAAVKQRLQEYLSVYNWPWEGTVRRYEIISIVDQVPGVDYVTTLFDPATDLTYSGSTLVRAGRLQVSVPGETTAEFTTTAVLTVSAEGPL